jgi:hypothetical protein
MPNQAVNSGVHLHRELVGVQLRIHLRRRGSVVLSEVSFPNRGVREGLSIHTATVAA